MSLCIHVVPHLWGYNPKYFYARSTYSNIILYPPFLKLWRSTGAVPVRTSTYCRTL